MSNKVFEFPATLIYDVLNKKSNYTVQFGIENQSSYNKNTLVYYSSEKPKYYQLIVNDTIYINAKYNERNYYFKDFYNPIKWEITNIQKKVNNINLTKVTFAFRGRNYIAWIDLKTDMKIGPWKFFNPPGLIYEATDTQGFFSWKLYLINDVSKWEYSPFENYCGSYLSYKEYPIIRYKEDIDNFKNKNNNPFNTKINSRNDLEILFEWEK